MRDNVPYKNSFSFSAAADGSALAGFPLSNCRQSTRPQALQSPTGRGETKEPCGAAQKTARESAVLSSLHQGLLGMPVTSNAREENLSWGEEHPLVASLLHPRLPGELTKHFRCQILHEVGKN